MLDDRVRAVLARLEQEDAEERRLGLPRRRALAPDRATTGRFLFALVAPQAGCEVLEIGGSRGYSTIWLAARRPPARRPRALARADPLKIEAWRRNIAEAGLEEWAELVEGDAFESLARIDDTFDVVFLDAEKDDYEALFGLARDKLEPGGLVVADNVLSHVDAARARTRPPARPTRRS